jgi:hypothetical protein
MKCLLTASFLVALATGCYSEESVGVGVGYAAPAPGLVYVSPGVQVVADYDYPVFYSDNFYWRYDNGLWYRSGYLGGGWAVSYNVPGRIRGIDRPYAYAHYRGGAYGGPAVRDHRGYQPGYRQSAPAYRQPAYRQAAPARAPVVRNHR